MPEKESAARLDAPLVLVVTCYLEFSMTPEPANFESFAGARQPGQGMLPRFASAPLLAEPHLLGEPRTRRHIIGRNHRRISR